MTYFRCLLLLLFTATATVAQNPGSGRCLSLNGSNQYVDLGTQVGTGIRTIEMWFSPGILINSSLGSAMTLIARNNSPEIDEFGLIFSQGGPGWPNSGSIWFVNLVGTTRYDIFTDVRSWDADRWYHVAAVIDPVLGGRIYVNGVLQSQTHSNTAAIAAQTQITTLGRWGNLSIRHFDGKIDEVRLWTTARTQTEIRDNMCRKISPSTPGLKAYYAADQTAGNSLPNSTSTSFGGTTYNSPSWVLSGAPVGDRSVQTYSNQNIQLQSLAGDSIEVEATVPLAGGEHLYIVDQLTPLNQRQNLNVVPGVAHYFGVFVTDTVKLYDLKFRPNTTLSTIHPNEIGLANRADNSRTAWIIGTNPSLNNPEINIRRNGIDQFSPHLIPCSSLAPIDIGNDTSICPGLALTLGTAIPAGYKYLWSTNDTTSSVSVSQAGTYWLRVTYNINCVKYDTVNVVLKTTPQNYLPADTLACDSIRVSIQGPLRGISWSNGAAGPVLSTNSSGLFWFNATDSITGCAVSDSIDVRFSNLPEPISSSTYYLCSGQSIQISLDSAIYPTAQWSNGNMGPTANYATAGVHWVIANNQDGCTTVDTFLISLTQTLDSIRVFNDTSLCFGQQVILEGPDSLDILWPNGSDSTYTVSSAQLVSVEVGDSCSSKIEDINVVEEACECKVLFPNAFSPNEDGVNDLYVLVQSGCDTNERLEIYSRWGIRVFRTNQPYVEFWDGKTAGEECPIGTYVYLLKGSKGIRKGYINLIR